MVSKPPRCSNVMELLDWFDLDIKYTLVLKHPSPCTDLRQYTHLQDSHLFEVQTRDVMLQVVQAVHHCCYCGVLYCNIKVDDILINTETLQSKLIDFKTYPGNFMV